MCYARVATVVSAARPLGAVRVVNMCKGLRGTSLLNVTSPGESSGNLLRRRYGLEVDVQPCRYFSCRHDIAFCVRPHNVARLRCAVPQKGCNRYEKK